MPAVARRRQWPHRALALLGAVTVAVAGCGSPQSAQPSQSHPPPASSVDWSAVQRALGAPLQTEEGVHHVDIPRTDLHVTVGDVPLQPGMELGAEANFLPSGAHDAVLVGEITVLDAEQQPVIDALQHGGLSIAAVHKHVPAQSPDLLWVHFVGYGHPEDEAAAVHRAIAATATPLPPSSGEPQPPPGLDVAGLDAALGGRGKVEDGVYKVSLPSPSRSATPTRTWCCRRRWKRSRWSWSNRCREIRPSPTAILR